MLDDLQRVDPHFPLNDFTYLRFLRARKHNIDAVMRVCNVFIRDLYNRLEICSWTASNGGNAFVRTLLTRLPMLSSPTTARPLLLSTFYSTNTKIMIADNFVHGRDRKGQPIMFVLVGRVPKFDFVKNQEKTARSIVFMMERVDYQIYLDIYDSYCSSL